MPLASSRSKAAPVKPSAARAASIVARSVGRLIRSGNTSAAPVVSAAGSAAAALPASSALRVDAGSLNCIE